MLKARCDDCVKAKLLLCEEDVRRYEETLNARLAKPALSNHGI